MISQLEVTSPEAFAFLREQLLLSDKTFAVQISALQIETGRVFAFVPQDTPASALYRFDSGGIYPFVRSQATNGPELVPIRNDAREVIVALIISFINADPRNCCIMEEPHATPSFPWVKNSEIEYVHIGEEMFYFFDKANFVRARFLESFTISEGYYFLCAIANLTPPERQSFSTSREITSKVLSGFVARIEAFFVRAYDYEGYLMWMSK